MLRISVSAMMITHGYPKALKLMAGDMDFSDPYGIGSGLSLILVVFAELICSALLIIGLGTRLASIVLIITMITAAFVVHADHGFQKQEMALLYLLLYLTILILGPGKYALDKRFGK
jgi:putative oxidoreductase